MIELGIVAGFPVVLWLCDEAGANMTRATVIALVLLFAADRFFKFAAVLPIMTPVLLIGGMTAGIFTATEGAIAACVWALFLGVVWYRTMSLKALIKASMDTIETTAVVLMIVAAASIFGWMLTATRTTEMIANWVLAFTTDPWMFLLLANLLMLFVGCFLEPTAAITILVPILLPIVQKLGIDPVHFGLVMVLNLMIGLLHPPMGLVLFVLARVAKLSVERTTMAILPWLVPLLVSLVAGDLRARDQPVAATRHCSKSTRFRHVRRHRNPFLPSCACTPPTTSSSRAAQLVSGTRVPGEDVDGQRPDPAGPQDGHAGDRRRQRGASLQPDHRLRQARHPARRARPPAQPDDRRGARRQHRQRPARLRVLRRCQADPVRRQPGHLPGHRAARRARRHAQLHRHPVDGELLGHRGARDRRPVPP